MAVSDRLFRPPVVQKGETAVQRADEVVREAHRIARRTAPAK